MNSFKQTLQSTIFNETMLQALLRNQKTKLIIPVKIPKGFSLEGTAAEITENIHLFGNDELWHQDAPTNKKLKLPYKIGETLFVREKFADINDFENLFDFEIPDDLKYLFKYDDQGEHHTAINVGVKRWQAAGKMPYEATRLFLTITNLRVEKLQDIKPIDIITAGLYPECYECIDTYGNGTQCCYRTTDECHNCENVIDAYKEFWDNSIRKTDQNELGWNVNPWVFVYKFEKRLRT